MSAYDVLQQRHGAALSDALPRYMARNRWSRGEIEDEQRRQLLALLRSARDRSPWHASRLASIELASVSPADLSAIPTMTKVDLMANFDQILADRRLSLELVERHLASLEDDAYLLSEYHAVASGGSTGTRGVFVFGWDAWVTAFLCMLRLRTAHMAANGIPRDALRAVVAGGKASHMSFAMIRCFGRAVNSINVPASMPLAEIVGRLNDAQPTVVSGYPSMVFALAHEQAAGRLNIHPRVVWCASEPVLPEIRQLVADIWDVALINTYATSEGAFASDCGAGRGLHLYEDTCIFEPVDELGQPVPPGERAAKLYVTPLYNPVQPLIRYELTDEVTVVDGECPCGSSMRMIEDIGGRSDDVFRYGEVLVHPMAFRSPLGRQPNIVEYQVRQTAAGADIAYRAVGEVPVDALREHLESELRRLGLSTASVELQRVGRLERQGTGKLKRFVPL